MVSEVKRNRSKIIEVGEISASLREAALQCVSAYVRGMIAEIGERTGVVREELRVCGEICGRFLEELESI
jgi:hypothetical protein